MKATKLMSGDWVEVISNDHLKYVQITEIYQNSILTKESEFESEEVSIDNIKPIPLTPEILEKNGFERSEVFVEWKYEDDNVYMIYKPFPYLKIQTEECIVAFPCQYAHELQHALRLCEIEKKLKVKN